MPPPQILAPLLLLSPTDFLPQVIIRTPRISDLPTSMLLSLDDFVRRAIVRALRESKIRLRFGSTFYQDCDNHHPHVPSRLCY